MKAGKSSWKRPRGVIPLFARPGCTAKFRRLHRPYAALVPAKVDPCELATQMFLERANFRRGRGGVRMDCISSAEQ
jgi:hypothetical protein